MHTHSQLEQFQAARKANPGIMDNPHTHTFGAKASKPAKKAAIAPPVGAATAKPPATSAAYQQHQQAQQAQQQEGHAHASYITPPQSPNLRQKPTTASTFSSPGSNPGGEPLHPLHPLHLSPCTRAHTHSILKDSNIISNDTSCLQRSRASACLPAKHGNGTSAGQAAQL